MALTAEYLKQHMSSTAPSRSIQADTPEQVATALSGAILAAGAEKLEGKRPVESLDLDLRASLSVNPRSPHADDCVEICITALIVTWCYHYNRGGFGSVPRPS